MRACMYMYECVHVLVHVCECVWGGGAFVCVCMCMQMVSPPYDLPTRSHACTRTPYYLDAHGRGV